MRSKRRALISSFKKRSAERYSTRRCGDCAAHFLGDRMHQVGLPQADAAVEKQRVVRAGGRLGDRARGGVGELVGRADDEGLEGEARIRARAPAPAGAPAEPSRRRHGRLGLLGLEADRRPGKPAACASLASSAPCRDSIQSAKTREGTDTVRTGAPRRRRNAPAGSGRTRSLSSFGSSFPSIFLRMEAQISVIAISPISTGFPQLWNAPWQSGAGEYIAGSASFRHRLLARGAARRSRTRSLRP